MFKINLRRVSRFNEQWIYGLTKGNLNRFVYLLGGQITVYDDEVKTTVGSIDLETGVVEWSGGEWEYGALGGIDSALREWWLDYTTPEALNARFTKDSKTVWGYINTKGTLRLATRPHERHPSLRLVLLRDQNGVALWSAYRELGYITRDDFSGHYVLNGGEIIKVNKRRVHDAIDIALPGESSSRFSDI